MCTILNFPAPEFGSEIDEYLHSEIKEGAVIGPFNSSPFEIDVILSPLNTCPKKETDERRVIVDLSYPKFQQECSVNGGIDKDSYLGQPIRLRYPSVDDLVSIVWQKGRGCALFMRDLRRAYRQFPVDPGDLHLLAYSWKGQIFIDRVLTMGLRSAAYLCQRITNAVAFMCREKGLSLCNYLDDIAGAETWDRANDSFERLHSVLKEAGLQESEAKACSPSSRMIFLGMQLDTQKMTLEVSQERLVELQKLLESWETKEYVTKTNLKSLLGVLQFVAACVRPGRIFMSRLLNALRECPETGSVAVSGEILQDIKWWKEFVAVYIGVSMMPEPSWSTPIQL